jgi:hypothetical protein
MLKIIEIMIPQKSPLITPLTKTTPEIPVIGEVISEIPRKAYTISPGGKVGTTTVIPKRKRKDMRKIKTTNIFNEVMGKLTYFL